MTLTPWPGDPITGEAVARARQTIRARGGFPRVGDGVHVGVNLLESYGVLVAVAMARAEFYGELLERQLAAHLDDDGMPGPGEGEDYPYADEGTDPAVRGLIGQTVTVSVVGSGRDTETVATPTGEEIRALVVLEERERDRAARLIEKAVAMGVELNRTEVIVSFGRSIAAALQALATELGVPIDDEAVLRAAKRAGLTARRVLGHDEGDPDRHIGPRMSPVERVRALRAALDKAERDAAAGVAG